MNSIIKNTFFCLLGSIIFFSCTLDEDPRFPSTQTLFSDLDGANTVLNGAYAGMIDFNYKGADFMHLTYLGSGMFTSNKTSDYDGIISGNPYPSLNYVENMWAGCYRVISRANDVVANMEQIDLGNTIVQNNILGQAYFLRAFTYFDLVRTYGGVPMPLSPASVENNNLPRSTEQQVYTQIIADLEKAATLLPEPETQITGRPGKYAANMMLAKVYMQLAGNAEGSEYWQKAYNEAIKVYGKYSLVSNYNSLWDISTCNNTSESIFEVMGNIENTLRLHQLFTASNGNIGQSVWGRIKPNIELYDLHAAKYPGDPRLGATFTTDWIKFSAGKESLIKSYPGFTGRGNTDKSYPWLNKYFIKDIYAANYNTNMNYVALRYADLLLMLAEIENELNGPANAYQYVNKVLDRARKSIAGGSLIPKDWSGMTKEQFREAIMFEYRYELLGEGHDWFNMKRRGWEYFKKNVVDFHNNYTGKNKYDWTKKGDNTFGLNLADQSRLMLMPIPAAEMTANPSITVADQNPGY